MPGMCLAAVEGSMLALSERRGKDLNCSRSEGGKNLSNLMTKDFQTQKEREG